MLVFSVILISLALIIYTIPILNEVKRKLLLPWHAVMFHIGFVFDLSSTIIMYKIAGSKVIFGVHGILGNIALLLMLINSTGSVVILNKKHTNLLTQFYKFSFFAWIIWITSYILGVFKHM